MCQMTLFIKKVIYKKYDYNQYSPKGIKLQHFYKIFLGEHAPKRAKPLIKSMASLSCGYVQRISLTHANLHFRKKIFTPY